MKAKAIIFDLDGTLADISERKHHLEGKKNWKKFFQGIPDDKISEWCHQIIERFKKDHSIIIVTGRPKQFEDWTLSWLEKHGVEFNEIHFRPTGDNRSDDIVKKEIYRKLIQPNHEILFVVDDRKG